MSRLLVVQEGVCLLSGDTFHIKERLKALGCRWDPARKCWTVPATAQLVESFRDLGFVMEGVAPITIAATPAASPSPARASQTKHPESDGEHVFSVREFVSLVEAVVRKGLPGSYWITGEISGFRPSHGHVYFDLVENETDLVTSGANRAAAVSCVLWKGRRELLAPKMGELNLEDGLKVKLLVHCDFRRETSRISAIVDDIDTSFTMGDLALTRQNIVRELRKRGLYDRNRATRLAPIPLRVALVTARDSRAATDFFDELRLSGLSFSVTFFDCHTQGESTSAEVSRALALIAARPARSFDCVVITRGGGSRMDLRWFDDLEICKAIAYCPVPVITAIGHFEDVSVADEVAWRAEKTPTGAARFLSNAVTETVSSLFARVETMTQKVQARLSRERQAVARFEQKLSELVRRRTALEHRVLEGIERTLKLVRTSQEKTLERGFALVQDASGKPLLAAAFLSETPPRVIQLRLRSPGLATDVVVDTTVERVHPPKTPGD